MTSCPWRLTLESEGPRVHQLSRATLARARGPAGSTRCHGRNVPGSACQRCRPEFTGDSALARVPALWTSCTGTHTLVSKALGGDQLSRETPARLRVPAGSTSCPRPLVLWSEGHRVDMVFRATRTVPEGPGIEQLSRATRALVRGPLGSTSVPAHTGLCPRARGVDHLFRATQAGTRGPTVSTNSPGHLGFWSRVPR